MPHAATSLLRRITGLAANAGHSEPPRVHFDMAARRRSDLAAEARRLLRRRTVALAVASRCRVDPIRLPAGAAEAISTRALRRASGLHGRFHRTLDALVGAGGFDEALRILHERKGDTAGPIAQRASRRYSDGPE